MNILILAGLITLAAAGLYQPYYNEALQIAKAMSFDQKLGQTLQVDFGAFSKDGRTDEQLAINLHLGSLLVGGDGMPDQNGNMVDIPDLQNLDRQLYSKATMSKWQKLAQKFNFTVSVTTAQNKRYNIRPLLGTDAVHGNQHVSGTILFPHNSGLACSHNPDNFFKAGKWTSEGVKKSGFNYAFAPTVAVSHNPQWGRFYQTMGQNSQDIYHYAKAYTEGIQGKAGSLTGILGSVKHFYGDGATVYGADEGNAITGSYKSFISHNTQGYNGSIAADIGSVMVSYSSVNWIPNAIGPGMSTILRQKLKFDGFTISDYDEVQRVVNQGLPTNFNVMKTIAESVTTMLNAGMDMLMIPGWRGISAVDDVVNGYRQAYKQGTITDDRINDAVARIISVKLALGVANLATSTTEQQHLTEEPEQASLEPNAEEYSDALTAVHESLVLLRNDKNVLPFSSSIKYVVLVGERMVDIKDYVPELFRNFDNIGMQNGGWTLRWQGFEGNSLWQGDNLQSSNASSILTALQALKGDLQLVYPKYSSFVNESKIRQQRGAYLQELKVLRKNMTASNTVILSVLGETPFAEFKGDVGVPYCTNKPLYYVGCLYPNANNHYTPQQERQTLAIDYEYFDGQVINTVQEQDANIPLVTVLLSGRPMLLDTVMNYSQAVVSAWLPGTAGGAGIVDALTGKYKFRPGGSTDQRNTLAFDWPRTHQSLKLFPVYESSGEIPRIPNPLFTNGHGLSTSAGSEMVSGQVGVEMSQK